MINKIERALDVTLPKERKKKKKTKESNKRMGRGKIEGNRQTKEIILR